MNLRTQVMRGGMFLAARQGLSMVLSVVGILLLTRTIGPKNYGLYAAAIGMYTYIQNVAQLGISVYLVRQDKEGQAKVYHQAFTLLLLLGITGMALGIFGRPVLEHMVGLEGIGQVTQILFLGIPFALLKQVPLARLERNLDYRRVAMIEFWNHLFYYVIALPLAFQGAGVWAPVGGWLAQEIQATALLYWSARYRPQWYWNRDLIRQMLTYSISYSSSIWIWQMRTLVNPMIVGRFAGAEAVGYVALAIRLVETLGFVKRATWRISISALARIQSDPQRLVKAATEGMALQVLAMGPVMVIFAWIGPHLLPLMFGPNWLPVVGIYPFIALSYLTNSMFNLHSSILYVLEKNWLVTYFHLVHITLFAGSAFFLVPWLGITGYGWAEAIALLSYGSAHFYILKSIGCPDYRLAGLWYGAFALALFVYQLGYWAGLGVVAVVMMPQTHRKVLGYIKSMRRATA